MNEKYKIKIYSAILKIPYYRPIYSIRKDLKNTDVEVGIARQPSSLEDYAFNAYAYFHFTMNDLRIIARLLYQLNKASG